MMGMDLKTLLVVIASVILFSNQALALKKGSFQQDVITNEASHCFLEPAAKVVAVHNTQVGPCVWKPVPGLGSSTSSCQYELSGFCNRKEVNGCTFYGPPSNEKRVFDRPVPYEPEAGEIHLNKEQNADLEASFQPCESRTALFLLSSLPGATPSQPALIAMGGLNSNQHIYYVENEIAEPRDIYDLGKLSHAMPTSMHVIVDIGANVGLFSIAACHLFPNATIYAFEPHPLNYRYLVKNLKAAGCEKRVRPFNAAVSKDGRTMDFTFIESIRSTTSTSLRNYHGVAKQAQLKVPSVSAANLWGPKYLGQHAVVDLMKVDCEGCEYEVVPAFQRSLVRKMKCETHPIDPKELGVHGQGIINQVKKACAEGLPLY
mmetsp:Transcript_142669/g.251882  ORF Transcript_142669/g.251882 Transcript_142669/m.251882 type:complete len:374 (+) Transcript_142669:21-1142(+)